MANTPSNLPPPPAPGGFAPPGGTPVNNAPNPAQSGPALSYGAPVAGSGTATPPPAAQPQATPSPTVPRLNQQASPAPSGVQPVTAAPARPIPPPAGGILSQPATAYGAQARNMPPAGQNLTPASSLQANGEPEVHTMPEKFLPAANAKKQMSSLKKMMLIGGTILAVMMIITAVVVLIFTRQQQAANQNVAVVNGANINRTNVNVANTNVNQNVNGSNANVNVNTNVNTNVNGNVNVNTNTNVNTNGPINTNTGETTEISSTKDTDKDGLTDNEEIIWGSSQGKPDTDGDGFLDGEEIVNGYSPTSTTTLAQDPTAASFVNNTYGYTVLYPARWVVGQLDESDVDILFTAETGEFVEVTVGSNTKQQTAKQWYLEQFPEIDGDDLETFQVDGVIGVKSIDGLTGYIASGDSIFVMTYNIGTRSQANFLTTFDMMLHTFSLSTNGTATGNQNNNQNTNQ